jgi:hypothetical protein
LSYGEYSSYLLLFMPLYTLSDVQCPLTCDVDGLIADLADCESVSQLEASGPRGRIAPKLIGQAGLSIPCSGHRAISSTSVRSIDLTGLWIEGKITADLGHVRCFNPRYQRVPADILSGTGHIAIYPLLLHKLRPKAQIIATGKLR